ncbi:hypothetical protein BCR32DRAFT_249898 [Anaeromyces robustus]|uniref:Uncharacterized protein n=1 Tax=Anaeromyces robustus TaxID=1754192 RepID=A0A1Y1WJ49_9FUNG|nr:hypothetical protein BCR32DRAFT_249898 [Anaeromyces robustus]|eukprot:ORX73502.1 hypothetical protein BCR32DRAFT_249898 [Anaeromyces robustus]
MKIFILKPGMPIIPTSDDIIKELMLPNNLDKTELRNNLNKILKGFKIYQDLITEEKEVYKDEFNKYKNNFENICQSVKNEILSYETKHKAIGETLISKYMFYFKSIKKFINILLNQY